MGYGSAFTKDAVVYWSKGEIHSVAKAGGAPRSLGKVEQQPMQILATADGKHVGWVDKDKDGKFSIQVLRKSKPKVVYASKGDITASVVIKKWVFFVERIKSGIWRLTRVPLGGGGAVRHSELYAGRIPSMLSASDSVYYYDLPARSVSRRRPGILVRVVVTPAFNLVAAT